MHCIKQLLSRLGEKPVLDHLDETIFPTTSKSKSIYELRGKHSTGKLHVIRNLHFSYNIRIVILI